METTINPYGFNDYFSNTKPTIVRPNTQMVYIDKIIILDNNITNKKLSILNFLDPKVIKALNFQFLMKFFISTNQLPFFLSAYKSSTISGNWDRISPIGYLCFCTPKVENYSVALEATWCPRPIFHYILWWAQDSLWKRVIIQCPKAPCGSSPNSSLPHI